MGSAPGINIFIDGSNKLLVAAVTLIQKLRGQDISQETAEEIMVNVIEAHTKNFLTLVKSKHQITSCKRLLCMYYAFDKSVSVIGFGLLDGN